MPMVIQQATGVLKRVANILKNSLRNTDFVVVAWGRRVRFTGRHPLIRCEGRRQGPYSRPWLRL